MSTRVACCTSKHRRYEFGSFVASIFCVAPKWTHGENGVLRRVECVRPSFNVYGIYSLFLCTPVASATKEGKKKSYSRRGDTVKSEQLEYILRYWMVCVCSGVLMGARYEIAIFCAITICIPVKCLHQFLSRILSAFALTNSHSFGWCSPNDIYSIVQLDVLCAVCVSIEHH